MIESIGFYGFCNGHPIVCNNLNETCDDVQVACKISEQGNFKSLCPSLVNTGKSESVFTRAFIRVIMTPGPYEYFSQYNLWGKEESGKWSPIDGRGVYLSHLQGRTTEGNTPFCALREIGDKDGVAFHIYSCGNWRIRILPLFVSNTEPRIAVDLGISDEELNLVLSPGQTCTLPEILIQKFTDFEESMADLHRYILKDPMTSTRTLPVIFNTWFDRFDELTLEHLRASLQAAAEVGCETYVIDAGWFGGDKPGWWDCIGDWRHEKTTVAPDGWVKAFADEVRAAGLNFGLWMEPERMHPSVQIAQEHPDYFVYCPETTFMRYRLELPEVAQFFENEIETLINKYDLKYIKTDMNMLLGYDATGSELFQYQRTFYEIIDRIRKRHPDFILENCSSGAMRADLETFRHFDSVFPSDNVNPWTMFNTIHGIWRRGLPGRIVRWNSFIEANRFLPTFGHETSHVFCPKEATWEEAEKVDLESLLIANFTSGMFSFSGDLASLSPANRQLVAKYVSLLKEKRSFMLNAAGHFLKDEPNLKLLELESRGEAMVQIIYKEQDAVPSRIIKPVALEPDSIYTCNGITATGSEFMSNGIEAKLDAFMHNLWRAKMFWFEKK